ncbi:MAG: hypothetical protein ACXVAT_19595, partial [Isosphaeraceae bacterium]
MVSLRLQQFPSRARALVVAAILMLGWITVAARAELLYFQKGGEVQAPASIEGNRVVIELAAGKYEFLREDFRKIVPGFTPQREWDARRQEAQSAGFTARYESVWWAITNGLGSEAAAELRALHGIDPKHAPTARMAATLDKLERPGTDPEFLEFRKALGISTRIARGPHVVLLHQQTETEAEERVALLERVITGYYLLFSAQGIELRVPERRLICAWFA